MNWCELPNGEMATQIFLQLVALMSESHEVTSVSVNVAQSNCSFRVSLDPLGAAVSCLDVIGACAMAVHLDACSAFGHYRPLVWLSLGETVKT